MPCFDENLAIELIEGLLPADARVAAHAHVEHCGSCRRLLSEIVRSQAATLGTPPDGEPVDAAWLPRGTLVDRYVVLEQVGAGASGAVYAAYDPALDRRIALKLRRTPGDLAHREALRARLLREAQAMARLSDRHVVTVHDVGTVGDDVFIAMEFVAGGTLRAWLAAARRSWPEIRAVFVAAGSGLAAAHGAGLVHRDFKPDNVMIGDDGRVAVTDFGLARATAADPESLSVDGGTLVETTTGAIMGTPAYMAPEQLRGDVATAASDQFSFCVALHEAVAGERPFAAGTLGELRAAHAARLVISRDVPARLARVLRRGLAADPAARYPSMKALLADLQPSPRSRWTVAAGGVALAVILGGLAVARSGEPGEPLCEDAPAEIATAWNLEHRIAIETAFRKTGAVYADAAARSVTEAGDRYAAAWTTEYAAACRATHVAHTQSEAALDLRMRCLRWRRRELAARAELFARADRDVVTSAVRAMSALRPIDDCADLEALASPIPPPTDPVTAVRLEALEARLTTVTAEKDAARYREALPAARAIADEATALGHAPFEARALLLVAKLQSSLGDWAGALTTLARAGAAADRGRDDVSRGQALLERIRGLLMLDRASEGAPLEREAEAIVARTGDRRLGASYAFLLGKLRLMDGDLAEAVAHLTRALRGYEALDGDGAFSVLSAQSELGGLLGRLGRFDDSEALLRPALAGTERLLGRDHPQVAIVLEFLARTLNQRGNLVEALAMHQRILEIRERTLAAESEIGEAHRGLGIAYESVGRRADALRHLRSAVAIAERHPERAQLLGLALVSLAEPLSEDDGTVEVSLALCRRALELYRSIDDRRNIPQVLLLIAKNEHRLHRDGDALAHVRASITGWETFLGPDHHVLAFALHTLADIHVDNRRYADAIEPLERAVRVRGGAPSVYLAQSQFRLGEVLELAGRDHVRARELVTAARALYASDASSAKPLADADAWLAAHR